MTKKDGGPAFPGIWRNSSDRNTVAPNGEIVPPFMETIMPGMSLRDYFAAAALQGELAAQSVATGDFWTREEYPQLVKACYAAADAMLTERNKEKEND